MCIEEFGLCARETPIFCYPLTLEYGIMETKEG